jgi:uncharacterized protein
MVYIDISKLTEGLNEVVLEPVAEDLELDPDMFFGIVTRVNLHISEGQVICTVDAHAEVALVCDRTLEPFVESIDGNFTAVFTKDPSEVSDEDDGVFLLDADASGIDITDVTRDTLLLSVPLRKVAPAAREAELNLKFGGSVDPDDDIDPRWEALRKLKTDV